MLRQGHIPSVKPWRDAQLVACLKAMAVPPGYKPLMPFFAHASERMLLIPFFVPLVLVTMAVPTKVQGPITDVYTQGGAHTLHEMPAFCVICDRQHSHEA